MIHKPLFVFVDEKTELMTFSSPAITNLANRVRSRYSLPK